MALKPSKPKKKTTKVEKTTSLRKRAESVLAKQKERLLELSSKDLKKLVHELGTHQIELEMQNEDLQRSQDEIDSSRRKYADLYDFSPVGYFTFDKNGLIQDVNHTGAGMLDREKRLLISRPIQNFIELNSHAAFRSHLRDVFRIKTRQTCEIYLKNKSGVQFPAQFQSIVVDSGEETSEACRTVVIDISERKRIELSLSESEEKFRTLFESASDALFIIDMKGKILDTNAIAYERLGYTKDELLRMPLSKLEDPYFAALLPERMEIMKKNGHMTVESVHLRKNGSSMPVELNARVMNLHGEPVIFSVVRDITERKKAEQHILALNKQLKRQVAKLDTANKELEAFIYSVSHDLRAPLNWISGFTQLLYEGYADRLDTEAKDYLTRIKNGSDRMSQLIEDLLRLSSISRQDTEFVDYDLSSLASTIVKSLRDATPARNVEVVIAEDLHASVDPELMKIALTNLLNNAWKFTSKTENARIEFGITEKDAKTVYFIKDNGAGFNPAYADKMFLPFHRLHPEKEFEGTGIGLAIVERIICRHEGKVWSEGKIDKGATIYFTLG